MGSYAGLHIDSLGIYLMGSHVQSAVLLLFTPEERHETHLPRPREHGEEDLEEEELETDDSYSYRCTAGIVSERLDVWGFTLDRAKSIFDQHVAEAAEHDSKKSQLPVTDFAEWRRYIGYIVENRLSKWNINLPRNKQFERLLKDWDKDNYPLLELLLPERYSEDQFEYGFPHGDDMRYWLRAMFSSVSADAEIELDYTALIDGGYYESPDLFVEHADKSTFQLASTTILLTEGSTDQAILSLALKKRYPHLAHMYQFLDFHQNKAPGGAPELVKLVKAFAGCGVSGRFIAIFDADTAGLECRNQLLQASLPPNIKVMSLPELPLARQYPTYGPQGDNVSMDINGLACGVEMYLGETVLKDGAGNFSKVQWTGYNQKMKCYQGELAEKETLRASFLEKLARNEPMDWSGIDLIFQKIFGLFN